MDRETAERIIVENSKEQFGRPGYLAPNNRGILANYTGGQFKLLRDLEQSGAPLTRAIIFKVVGLSRFNPKNKALIERYSRNIDEDYYSRTYPNEFKVSEVPPIDRLLNDITWWKLTDAEREAFKNNRQGPKEWRVATGREVPLEEEEEEVDNPVVENPVVPQAPVVQEEIQEPQPVPIEEAVPLQEQVAPANTIDRNIEERGAIIYQIAVQEINERQAQDEQTREAARIERGRLTTELQRLRKEYLDIVKGLDQNIARKQEELRQSQRRGDTRETAKLLQQIDQLQEQKRQLVNHRNERERVLNREGRERPQQLRNPNPNPNPVINEVQNRNQEIQAAQGAMDANIAQIENEVPRVRPFDQLVDDLNEVYLREGYSPDEQRELNNILQNRPEQEILDFIAFARDRGPVDYRDFENREGYVPPAQAPPAQELIENPDPLIEPEDAFFDALEPEEPAAQVAEDPGDIFPDEIIGPEAVADIQNGAQVDEPMIAAGDIAQEPQGLEQAPGLEPEPEDPELEPEQGPAVPGQVPGPAIGSGTPDKLQYKKRYHETSLRLFFQNSSVPNWDPVLESNIMSLDIPKREIVEMMEQVISEYGPVIHVTKRKSSTLEELNELVQLQFCVMRNLHMGPRTRTATVKLSDLENLQRVAAGGAPVMNGANAAQPIEVRVPQESETPLVQTKEEFNFYKNYDRVQHLKSLGDYVRQVNRNPFIKTKNDAKTLGLIKGNNFQSVADYAKRGPHRLKPLSTFVRKNKS